MQLSAASLPLLDTLDSCESGYDEDGECGMCSSWEGDVQYHVKLKVLALALMSDAQVCSDRSGIIDGFDHRQHSSLVIE